MSDVTRFDRGETLGMCSSCERWHRGEPEWCPHCHRKFATGEDLGSVAVTKVDRKAGTVTVSSPRVAK